MLQSGLIQNIQTRPDVFGARQFAPLPSQKVPLYTLPPIVGNTMYSPGQGESIGTQFFRDKMSPVRNFATDNLQGKRPSMDRVHTQFGQMEQPLMSRRQTLGLGEPNGNSSQR